MTNAKKAEVSDTTMLNKALMLVYKKIK